MAISLNQNNKSPISYPLKILELWTIKNFKDIIIDSLNKNATLKIKYQLLIAKLSAYGFDMKSKTENRKQKLGPPSANV